MREAVDVATVERSSAGRPSATAGRRIIRGLFALALAAAPVSQALAALGASVTLNSGQPTAIYPGQTTELKITLSNSDPNYPITGVAFSTSLPGTLPNGLEIAGTYTYTCTDPSGPTTSAGSGTLTAISGSQTISLGGGGGSIPAHANNTDGTCTIIVPVTAGTSSGSSTTYTYTIAGSAVTGSDNGTTVTNSGTVNQSINVKAISKPTIAKKFGSSTLYLGGRTTPLTITVSNPNSVAIANFSVSDTFPTAGGSAIIKVAGTPSAASTCTGGGTLPVFNPTAGDTSLSASGGTLAANSSCTITVNVEAAQTNGAYSVSSTNTINASSGFTDDIGIPAAANASANITVTSPLGLKKAFSPSSLASGQSGTLTITLSNSGTSDLSINTFQDSPIDGVGNSDSTKGLLVTGVSNTCSGTATMVQVSSIDRGVLLTGGTIPAGGSCTVTANFTATTQATNTPYTYTNTINAGAVHLTGASGVVSQNSSATILVADTLRVSKSNNSSNPRPGNPAQYAITVQNWSTADMSTVKIVDNLPGGMTYLTGTINGINYTPTLSGTNCSTLSTSNVVGDSALTFIVGTVPQRTGISSPGSCTVTFYAMVSTSAANGASTVNSISSVCTNNGSGICYGAGASSGNSAVNTTVLTATKTFDGAATKTYAEGTISTLKIALANYSANALTNVTVSDTLPTSGSGQMRIASPNNAATTCGGSITAVAGSTSLSMNGATVPARAGNGAGAAGTCFIQVDVVGPAGIYANTATVAGTQTYANGTTAGVGPVTSSTATLTYTSAISATKTFSPASVSSGGKSTVTVRLSNSGAIALSGVAVTDPLPTGMVLSNPPNAYTTCAGGATVTAVAGASSIGMSGASIAGSGTCDLVFDVTATGSANWVNTIPVGDITASGGVRNQSAVVGTLTYAAPTGITVAKATNPSTLTFPGQVSQLTITVTDGSQAVSNLHLTDYFTANGTSGASPNGMIIAATPAASTTCPGGTVSAVAGGKSVALSGVSLAANAAPCTVTVNVTSTAVGGITNYIPAGAIVTDQGLTNNGQATTSLDTQSNIGVTKQFTPNVVQPGVRSRLRITFYNPTTQPMTSLAVTDSLPSGVTVPSGANPTTTCSGATVTSASSGASVHVSGGTIPAASGSTAASCYAEIDVVAASQGDYVNTIPAGGVTASSGGAAATNSQPASDTLRAKSPLVAHLAIALTTLDAGSPDSFTTGSASRGPGAAATLTIRLDNPNSGALTQAAFTDSLPSGLVVAQTPNAATTCTGGVVTTAASATSVRFSGGTIPASKDCTVTVDVLSNISGTYVDKLAAAAVSTFEGVSNAEPSSAQLVVSTPPTVDKQFSPAVIPPGGTSTLTILLGNDNSTSVKLSKALTDTLPTAPGNITVAATPNVSTTCSGTVTAAANSGTITLANGATIPAGGCSISVDVTGTTPGDYVNNIPAGALQTTLGNNQQPANAGLTISTQGYIAGKVFKDNNLVPNGSYDSGTDAPISGVSVELRSGSSCGGTLVSRSGLTNPATTDSLGNYLFAGLSAGTYTVCEPGQPTGTVNGITKAGTITTVSGSSGSAGTASNPTTTSSQIANIVLGANGSDISGSNGNTFAEVVPSGISGSVFVDQNNNGVQNGGDTGISGVTIALSGYSYGPNGVDNGGGGDDVAVNLSTTTDASGNYSFTSLLPGKYKLTEQSAQPSGTSNGITTAGAVGNGGTAGTATGVTTLPSAISGIVLPPNTVAAGNDFAEISNGRKLSGQIFLDYNNNGSVDNPPDHGIGGQTVKLSGTDINGNAVTATATTANDGSYSFTGLPAGTYTINQPSQPAGTTNGTASPGSTGGTGSNPTTTSSTISGIGLTGNNTVSANNDFAEKPGSAPDLAISKTHTPASFGAGSNTGYYTIVPSNIGTASTSGTITVVDDMPTGITPTSASGTGWGCSIAGQKVTCTSANAIAASGTGNAITLHVAVATGLAGQVLINTATISGGSEPPGFSGNNSASDPTPISTTAIVQGHVWLDANDNHKFDAGETPVAGWKVELLLGGSVVDNATTDSAGAYTFNKVAPGSGYQIRFRDPASDAIFGQAVPNETGASFTEGVVNATANPGGANNSDGTLKGLTLTSGSDVVQQSLPLDPSGVVYNSVSRQPVAGATVTISGPAGFDTTTELVGGASNAKQVTGSDGYYQFLLFSTAPAGTYTIAVTPPASYVPGPSKTVPPCSNTPTIAATPNPAEVQNSASAPASSVPLHNPATCPSDSGSFASGAGTTQYYYSFAITPGTSGNVVNNHIPIDPVLQGAIVVTKTTPKITASRGDLVPYTITAHNTLAAALSSIVLNDQMPPGFKYIKGSARLDGVNVEPTQSGRNLSWSGLTFNAGQTRTLQLVLVIGSGVGDGKYVNQAWAVNSLAASRVSNIATASVQLIPDPTFDCSDIIGKVFDDRNRNGYPDPGEPGLPGVRLATVKGWLITTDAKGRFHIACADVPDESLGANFILKLDERTLPSGYRVTTENPRVVRLTQGKTTKINFGAAIHRVVRLDLRAAAFDVHDKLLPSYLSQLDSVIKLLHKSPSILRLAYHLQAHEKRSVARRRLKQLHALVKKRWTPEQCCYDLLIEDEIVTPSDDSEVTR